MREYSIPALADIPTAANLANVVTRRAAEQPRAVALRRKAADGSWEDVSCVQFRDEVHALAKGLIAAGISPGDRVAIMSHTRYEWTLVDYAAWTVGAVVVPIYETSSAEQAEWILSDSAARAVIVETDAFEDVITQARDRLPALEHLWRISPDLGKLVAGGTGVSDETLAERAGAAKAADLATDHLHLGHHRPPQGLRAQPREPARRRAQRVHGAARRDPRDVRGEHAAVPAARARLRADHRGRLPGGRHHPRALLRHEQPAARPGLVPAHLRARRAAGVREGLQRRRAAGRRRGQGQDLRARRADGGGLQRGARRARQAALRAARRACPVRPPGLQQAARRARRQGAVGGVRWRRAGAAARALLPRCSESPCSRGTG